MAKTTRRNSLALFALSPPAAWGLGDESGKAPAPRQHWMQISPRELIRQRYFPDVVLFTQDRKDVRLYQDLVKDKLVLINFMYTSCDRVCPRVTQNLVKVQHLLGARMGHDVFFCSFTLDPTHDTPEVLKDYAKMHGAGQGWSFLTGTTD